MTRSTRLASLILVAATWCAAASPLPSWIRAFASFLAVLVLPGLMLRRSLLGSETTRPEEPALALALSIGVIGVLGVGCSVLRLSITALNIALAAVSVLAAVAPKYLGASASATTTESDGPPTLVTRATFMAIVLLTLATIALAAMDVSIARDRMWYAAYVTRLASGNVLDWRDPVLGSGRIIWRFACNAWLLGLASWSALADVRAPWLIERCAPPLLVAIVPAAAYSFAHALFRKRDTALFTTLCTLVVLLASKYPYFAPEHTPLFIRLVEDKTAALLLLAPVATALALRSFTGDRRAGARQWIALSLVMIAVALAHGIVHLIVCISVAACAAWAVAAKAIRARNAAPVVAITAFLALLPLALGVAARRDALHVKGSRAALAGSTAVDPVVRAHLRMHRLHDLPAGGPIVEPELLADPVLVAAIIGIAAAAESSGTLWGAYASSTTLVFLALAFLPYVAPLFGRMVVPWMAYRALWGIPFGLLLAAGLMRLTPAFASPGSRRARNEAIAVVALLTAVGLGSSPWYRLWESETRLAPDAATLTLLDVIEALPGDSVIAAAPGLSELIPAYSGRSVLAFADRGTAAFAARRGEAERRLRANAAVIALHGSARGARLRLLAAHHVTHVVLERDRCEHGMRAIYADGRFTICEVTAGGTHTATHFDSSRADAHWIPQPSVSRPAAPGDVVAALPDGITCAPTRRPFAGPTNGAVRAGGPDASPASCARRHSHHRRR